MTIVKHAPTDVRQCGIYKRLLDTSTDIDGCAERTNIVVEKSSSLLDLIIAGPFKEYTLHNHDHAKKLLHLSEYVIAPETLAQLSALECQVFICSAYLHDIGMVLTSAERETILRDPEFLDEFRGWIQLWYKYQLASKRLGEMNSSTTNDQKINAENLLLTNEIYQMQEAALCNYLRIRHAKPERYRQIIKMLKSSANRDDLFSFNGHSFEDLLIEINASHVQDVGILAEVYGVHQQRFPTDLVVAGHRFNTQFIAAVLRVTDILDFDCERTPRILFESLGISSLSLPGADVTLKEWKKHMDVHSLQITDDEIIVSCECRHPATEKTIREFCQVIEREIRDTTAVVRQNAADISETYKLQLPISIRPSIISKGYIYKDISLQLNQVAITSLIMGERLYHNQAAALRELIQNSIDACAARQKLQNVPNYIPLITVISTVDAANRHWIEVFDNGIGMDEHVIAEYFLKLGNSYYNSPEFERIYSQTGELQPFKPIAKFGIGILSVFMIADILEVMTRCSCSPRRDDKARLVRVEHMGGLAFIAESPNPQFGTYIRIRLKPEIDAYCEAFITSACSYLKTNVVHPAFNIKVHLSQEDFILSSAPKLALKPNTESELLKNRVKPIVIELNKWSEYISGTIILFFSINLDGTLSYLSNTNKPLRISRQSGPNAIDPNNIVENYTGNRITVNGFRMTLKKILRIYKRYIAAVLDIDVSGDKNIEYEVSRERISGQGALYLRNSIRAVTLKALLEMGVLDKMDQPSKDLINTLMQVEKPWSEGNMGESYITPEILERVRNLLPDNKWPPMIGKEIANKLNISNTLASRAISQLIKKGLVKKPSGDILPEKS